VSRAFVKEQDGGEPEPIAERPVSAHPNLVTAEGLAMIDRQIEELREREAAAQAADDRAAVAQIGRDARYWSVRRSTAKLVTPPTAPTEVAFGTTVTIARDDGREQTYRIVGEDEADPNHGTLSHVSPLARSMTGKTVGDTVRAGNTDAEIIAIR
jgi:transcription elongation GreA/GreB family factor